MDPNVTLGAKGRETRAKKEAAAAAAAKAKQEADQETFRRAKTASRILLGLSPGEEHPFLNNMTLEEAENINQAYNQNNSFQKSQDEKKKQDKADKEQKKREEQEQQEQERLEIQRQKKEEVRNKEIEAQQEIHDQVSEIDGNLKNWIDSLENSIMQAIQKELTAWNSSDDTLQLKMTASIVSERVSKEVEDVTAILDQNMQVTDVLNVEKIKLAPIDEKLTEIQEKINSDMQHYIAGDEKERQLGSRVLLYCICRVIVGELFDVSASSCQNKTPVVTAWFSDFYKDIRTQNKIDDDDLGLLQMCVIVIKEFEHDQDHFFASDENNRMVLQNLHQAYRFNGFVRNYILNPEKVEELVKTDIQLPAHEKMIPGRSLMSDCMTENLDSENLDILHFVTVEELRNYHMMVEDRQNLDNSLQMLLLTTQQVNDLQQEAQAITKELENGNVDALLETSQIFHDSFLSLQEKENEILDIKKQLQQSSKLDVNLQEQILKISTQTMEIHKLLQAEAQKAAQNLEHCEDEKKELKERLQRLLSGNENAALMDRYKESVESMRRNMQDLRNDNDKLSTALNQVKEAHKEVEIDWKRKMSVSQNKVVDLEDKNKKLEEKNNNLMTKIEKIQNENDKLKEENQKLKVEMSRVTDLLTEKEN